MSQLTANQLRRRYLDFFIARGHVEIPSSPLVPENDPTTLFTSAGMQPLVPYLLGQLHPKGTRLVDSQKSFRSQDIEEVGDNRHTTFFEMLGNWSLGDYFKTEQIEWLFTFLVTELGLDPHRLYISVYGGNKTIGVPRDIEAVAVWQKMFAQSGVTAAVIEDAAQTGLDNGRIFYYGDTKNWWSRSGEPKNMPVGEPGGPDSEVFFDFDPDGRHHIHQNSIYQDQPCHVNCDCGRFLEIGNSVFMQYQRTEHGFEELPKKNIDFGGGLERLLAAVHQNSDVFTTDLFLPLIHHLEELSGQKYGEAATLASFRVIADHIKAATMLASDGVFPGSKQQSYFSRRLIRRAVRHGRKLGIEKPFVADLVQVVAEIYREPYPQVDQKLAKIQQGLQAEEQKFLKTLSTGLKEFEKLTSGISTFTAQQAFTLYETYGFPVELSIEEATQREMILEKNLEEKFNQLKQGHADQSRTASAGMFKGGLADQSETVVKFHTATHLLHAALRQILGETVQQKGSNITGERLRFDFSFDRALTEAEKQQVEQQINDWIEADLPVTKQILPKTEALQSGAIAFFIEKYPDEVSVYTIGKKVGGPAHELEGWISKEFCGGPHVTHTGEIGPVKITKEKSASAGVRRIYVELI